MIPIRESPANAPNKDLEHRPPDEGEGNSAWFGRAPIQDGIVLLGGSSLVDFRVRFAQSGLRSDLTPSYWSTCGLIRSDGSLLTVPLQPADVSEVPRSNAVRAMSIDDFDDPEVWPNIAVLRFVENTDAIDTYAQRVAERRTIVDLPALLVRLLAYVWATDEAENPLTAGRGVPSGAFVEAAYSLAGIDLTPGLASTASCPEAIWQAVKWWREFYAGVVKLGAAKEVRPLVPAGVYGLRQRSAAVRLPPDAPLFTQPPSE